MVYMNRLFVSLLASLAISSLPAPNTVPRAVIDRIEGDYAVVEFSVDDYIETRDIPVGAFTKDVRETQRLSVSKDVGKFIKTDSFYYFTSYTGDTRWVLTETDLGFVPELDTEYTLYFFDNFTSIGEDAIYDDLLFCVR